MDYAVQPDVSDRARGQIREARGDPYGEAPDAVQAAAAVYGQGGDCQAHAAVAADSTSLSCCILETSVRTSMVILC
jgi:hypothetical protein